MNRQVGLTTLLCAAMCLAAQAQNIPVGTYVYQGGNGELRIDTDGSFSLDTVGGNAHICNLEGSLKGMQGLVTDSACIVTFTREGRNIRLTDNGHDECRDACGVRASYAGIYFKPSPACLPKAMAATRKDFKSLFDKKKFSLAVQTLSPMLLECTDVLHHFDKAFVRNDLALAQLRSGDAEGCLVTLQPLKTLGSMTDEEVREIPEPTFADIYLRIARATRTNQKLCNAAFK